MKQKIKEKDIRDFEKYASKLAEVSKRIQSYNPDAHIFANMDSLELYGSLWEDKNNCVSSVYIPSMNCGEL